MLFAEQFERRSRFATGGSEGVYYRTRLSERPSKARDAPKCKAKKRSCNDPTISANLFKVPKSHKQLVINRVFLPLQIASLPVFGQFGAVTSSPFA